MCDGHFVGTGELAIDVTVFTNTFMNNFWSSTTDAASPTTRAWWVLFAVGHSNTGATSSLARAPCVRTP